MNKQQLKINYNDACNAYLQAFCKKHDFDRSSAFWCGNDVGGIASVCDLTFDMATIRTDIDEDAPEDALLKYYDYTIDAADFNLPTPNFHAWIHGCPRTSDEWFSKMRQMRENFENVIEKEKANIGSYDTSPQRLKANVKFKKTHPDAKLPTKAHDSDFCYDCYAVSREEVAPGVYKYGLGIALQIERNSQLGDVTDGFSLRPRSSVWKTGMVLSNSIATIDAGYNGEISAVFYHINKDLPIYEVGDRVVQLHLDSTLDIDFIEVDKLDDTDRGDGAYGSTGK